MSQRQYSPFSLSRRSTGVFELERDAEELSIVPLRTSTILNHVEAANRLSEHLLDDSASVNATAGQSIIDSTSATKAWEEHLSKMSAHEKQIFQAHSKGDLNQYISEISRICQKRGDESRGLKIAKLFQPWFDVINLYAPVARTMIQADPTSSALVLGGIMCIMSINQRYAEFHEQIIDMLAYMGEKAGVLEIYRSKVYQNNNSVQRAIVEVFANILEFCRLALPLLRTEDGKERGSAYTFAKSLITSYHHRFNKVIKKFERDLELFEDKARLSERLEYREARKETKNFQALQTDISMSGMGLMMQLGARQQSFHHAQMSGLTSGYHVATSHYSSWEANEAIRRKQEADRDKEILRSKIIAWLEKCSIKFHEDQNSKVRDRVIETGIWIVKHGDYITWKDSTEAQLLWVHGKRGCGKSFLTSVVVQDLKAMCESAENMEKSAKEKDAFAFIYCDSREADKHDLEKLFCSLAKQLCNHLPKLSIDPYLEGVYDRHGDTRVMDLEETQKALESLIGQFRRTYLVIDGLDELRILGVDKFSEQCRYFRHLTQPRGDGSAVKLVAFSRPEHLNIERSFAGCLQIPIDGGSNNADIKKFIDRKMEGIQLYFEHNPALITETKEKLLDQAKSMFLWVDRAINTLQYARTSKELRQKLGDLPHDLDGGYAASVAKISRAGDRALKALLWITNARRSLKHSELLEALAVSPGMIEITADDRISEMTDFCTECDNLIVFDRDKETYQLLHSSLRDYLMEEHVANDMPKDYHDLQRNAEKVLGETCITYLSFKQFDDGVPSDMDHYAQMVLANPFLEYASIYWGRHVASARDHHLYELAKSIVTAPERRDLSMNFLVIEMEGKHKTYPGKSNPLHILAMFDLVEVTECFSDLDDYVTQPDGRFAIPLEYALYNGSRRMCNKLLTGFKEGGLAAEKPEYCYFPVHAAASRGWDDIVRQLIDVGYDAETKTLDRDFTPFHIAAIEGSIDVLDVLLEKDVNMNAADIDGSTPLLRACSADNAAFAMRLVEAGADVKTTARDNTTALHYAVKNGRFELVQMLVRQGADMNIACFDAWGFRTPLHLAAETNRDKVLQYLIEQGADVDKHGPEGHTALHLSTIHDDTKCLEELLNSGAKVDTRTDDGRTEIHLAASYGRNAALKILLEARPHQCAELLAMTDDLDNTALHYAAYGGHKETVKYLIDHGASCERRNKSFVSPFLVAFSTGDIDMIRLFLKSDPTCMDQKGWAGFSVLQYVAHFGAKYPVLNKLTHTLLEAKANPEERNDFSHRAIHVAMGAGNIEFADILLENTPDLDLCALSTTEQTPMYVAAENGHSRSVEWLLRHGVSVQNQTKMVDGNSPMHISAWNGHLEVLQMLQTSGNVNEPGFEGHTALHAASARGHYDLVEYLLKNDADPNIATDRNSTPLIVSIQMKHATVAHCLLDWHADPHFEDTIGRTALHEAAIVGNETLVRRLLQTQNDPLRPDKFGQSPFLLALWSDNPEIIRIFVEEMQVDGWQQSTSNGQTCFHVLASFGDKTRLEKYKDLLPPRYAQATDELGRNALYYAAASGHAHLFGDLLSLGVPLQGTESSPRSPLQEAAEQGFTDSVGALIELQRDRVAIDENRGSEGRTALHLAISSKNPRTALMLLKAGADPSARDHLGLNGYDMALGDPSFWERTPFLPIERIRAELAPRMPQLKQLAQGLLEIILDQSEVHTSLDEFYRNDSLRLLGDILLEIGTEAAIQRAKICYLELASPPDSAIYSIPWTCDICGKSELEGSRWIFTSPPSPVLCNTCYCDHNTTKGWPASATPSVRTLEQLEGHILWVRKALMPFVHRGARFIASACRLARPAKMYLDERLKEYERWEEI